MKNILILLAAFSFGELAAQDFDRVFVFLHKNPNKETLTKEEETQLINKHFANMAVWDKEGKLINAGPFEGGGGIFVMNNGSVDTVTQWLKSDPAILANRWLIELYPFTTTIGGSCKLEPPYEMVSYQFVRYSPTNEIANYKSNSSADNEALFNDLDHKLKQNNQLLMAGHFASNEGGILIVRDSAGINMIKSSSIVSIGSLTFDYKELWIAKGSFCENK